MKIILQKSDFSKFIREVAEKSEITEIICTYYGEPDRHKKWICPFHNEKTPSFSVKNNHFRCFGCQKSGDAVGFTAEYFSISAYKAALKLNQDFALNVKPPTNENPAPEREKRPLTEYEKQKIREKWGLDTCDILSDYLKMLKQFSEERPQHDSNGQPMTNWKFTAYCHDYPITTYIVDCLLEKKKRDTIIDHWHDTAERLKNNFMKNLKLEREEKQNAK